MATPFVRSLRSVNSDGFRPNLVTLVLALCLLVAWLSWFFLARITLYEVSQNIEIGERGIVAHFEPGLEAPIHEGQTATIHIAGDAGRSLGAIPAVVMRSSSRSSDGHTVATLFPLENEEILRLDEETTGRVEVEVEYLSPALLVARASGIFADTPALGFNP